MPLVDVGRTNAPDRKLQPLPDRTLGDPDAVPHRHEPAYGPPAIQGLVDYIEALTGGGGPDIPTVAGGGKITDGGELFRLQCAACHSSTGEGGALEHREAPTTHPANERQIAEAVRVGPGLMPAFGNAALTDEQLASVVTYVRYLAKPSDRGGNPLSHLGPFAEGIVAFAGLAALVVATRWIGERG
jgi:ubiquinol-cytochrome c reductase cytochrome c subunit